MNESDISSEMTVYEAGVPRSITCKVNLPALRDAWRAVVEAVDNGRFALIISASELRFEASSELTVESVVPVIEVAGLQDGDAYRLDLDEDSFVALAVGDLPELGSILIDNMLVEEGFTGVLRLESTFTVQCPFTLTAISIDALTNAPVAGTAIDPRTIRAALSSIRHFAGEDQGSHYPLSTLQIVGEEARGMSPAACLSLVGERFKSIELRFRQSCAKPLNALLGQLKPESTVLSATAANYVLYDGRIRVTIPAAPQLPDWPTVKDVVGRIQLDAIDFIDTIEIMAAQATAKDVQTVLVVEETSEEMTLSVAVPGGYATIACPILPVNRSQSAPFQLPFRAQTIAMFRSANAEALQMQLFNGAIEIEQVAPHESRKMLVSADRPQNNYS